MPFFARVSPLSVIRIAGRWLEQTPRRPRLNRIERTSPLANYRTIQAHLTHLRPFEVNRLVQKGSTPKPLQATENALRSVMVHDHAPVDIGIILQSGFFAMIPAHTQLPYERVEYLSNVLDYDTRTSISICSRHSLLHPPSVIQIVEIHGTRPAMKENTKFKITMKVDKELNGYFTVRDTFTSEETTAKLDAWGILNSQPMDTPLLENPSS